MRLRDGTEVADPRLGRLIQFDERSRGYGVRAVLPTAWQHEKTRLWYLPSTAPILDQGRDGACVGFSVTNEFRYTPVPVVGLDGTFALQRIYWEAQKIDPWPGGAYPGAENDGERYEGTSVLAGLEVARRARYITEYRWAFGEKDLAMGVGHLGPAVIGVPWYSPGMFEPDADGYLWPEGEVAGGHAVLVVGISLKRDDYTVANSWGPHWGLRGGRARIKRAVMARLLAEQGEAAVVTGRTRPKVAR